MIPSPSAFPTDRHSENISGDVRPAMDLARPSNVGAKNMHSSSGCAVSNRMRVDPPVPSPLEGLMEGPGSRTTSAASNANEKATSERTEGDQGMASP